MRFVRDLVLFVASRGRPSEGVLLVFRGIPLGREFFVVYSAVVGSLGGLVDHCGVSSVDVLFTRLSN